MTRPSKKRRNRDSMYGPSQFTPSQSIQSIPTKVNGVLYQSRLEARWAIYFSNIPGLKFIYEPWTYSFRKDNILRLSYTPDFIIQYEHREAMIEVKPRLPNTPYMERMRLIRQLSAVHIGDVQRYHHYQAQETMTLTSSALDLFSRIVLFVGDMYDTDPTVVFPSPRPVVRVDKWFTDAGVPLPSGVYMKAKHARFDL